MVAYLTDMCSEIMRTQFKCNDQGIHNFIIRDKYMRLNASTFPFSLEHNSVNPLFTVGIAHPAALPFFWDGSYILRNSTRPTPPLVHQLQIFPPWNDVLRSLGLVEIQATTLLKSNEKSLISETGLAQRSATRGVLLGWSALCVCGWLQQHPLYILQYRPQRDTVTVCLSWGHSSRYICRVSVLRSGAAARSTFLVAVSPLLPTA
jgi:hypothetical protein